MRQLDADRCRAHAEAELNAGGDDRAVVRGDRARTRLLLVEQIGEFRPAGIVAGGGHVREVVRDHLDPHLLGGHPGGGDLQGAHSDLLFAERRDDAADALILAVEEILAQFIGALDFDHA